MRTHEKIFPCGGCPTTAHDAWSGEEKQQAQQEEEKKKKKKKHRFMASEWLGALSPP